MDNISEKEQLGMMQMRYEYNMKEIEAKGEQDRKTEETRGEQARKTEKLKMRCKVIAGILLLGATFGFECLSDHMEVPKKHVRNNKPPVY